MDIKRRLTALIMVLMMVMILAPDLAYAEDDQDIATDAPEILTAYPGSDAADSDTRLETYMSKKINEELNHPVIRNSGKLRKAAVSTRGSRLTGNDKAIYLSLRKSIETIASGSETSTVIYVPVRSIINVKSYYTAEDLGVADLYDNENRKFCEDALEAFYYNLVPYDFNAVLDALMADLPYEMYWYDITAGCSYGPAYGCGLSIYNGEERFRFLDDDNARTEDPQLVFQFAVSKDYKKSGSIYNIDPAVTGRVSASISNAAAIINKNAALADWSSDGNNKLFAYKNAICDLVSYDMYYDERNYGDTWQLINVFDNDPDTDVVCEGYSKAFQFLCDNTESFIENGIECDSVSGTIIEKSGSGLHMWNILHMDDGKNYIADITNCDSGTVGYPDKLFLKGCISGGSVSSGYSYRTGLSTTVRYDYVGRSGSGNVNTQTLDNYAESELVMSETDYSGPSEDYQPETHELTDENITISNMSYTGRELTPDPEVTVDGRTLHEGTDYVVSGYGNNVNAGTADVAVTGIGRYTGTVTAHFRILPKKITPSVSVASYVYDGKVKTPAVTVKDGSTKIASKYYSVKYSSGRKNAGTYTVTVTLKGNYSGSRSVSFNILPKGTSLKSLKTARKAFTVKWKKQSQKMSSKTINGYQIQYSTSKKFSSGNKTVTVSKMKTVSRKIKGLKSKTVYYVRIRTYIKTGGRTIYSKWSTVKSVKTR